MGSNAMALFRSVKRLGMTAYRRMFSRRGIVGLTSSEVFSLYMIELMDAPTIKDFAAYIGISQPNATYKINALVEKGYVEKLPSATDRREYHIYTTFHNILLLHLFSVHPFRKFAILSEKTNL